MNYPTLCVLSYERPDFFSRSMNSLENSRPGVPYQLIIHDDGSAWDDGKLYNQLTKQASVKGATVVLNKPGHNQGQGVALNRMFKIAQGDYIFKLDADLEYKSGWLLKAVKLMEDNPEIGLLGLLHYYHEPVDSRKTIIEEFDDWSSHTHILGSAFAVRRETWEELAPFKEHLESFSEDWDFQNRVTKSEKWVCALPKESLVENFGFGIGKSMVVCEDGSVRKIHTEPYLIGRENENLQ